MTSESLKDMLKYLLKHRYTKLGNGKLYEILDVVVYSLFLANDWKIRIIFKHHGEISMAELDIALDTFTSLHIKELRDLIYEKFKIITNVNEYFYGEYLDTFWVK